MGPIPRGIRAPRVDDAPRSPGVAVAPVAGQRPRDVERHAGLEHPPQTRAGSLAGFTGISGDYQPPTASELTVDTSARTVLEATDDIERMLVHSGILFEEPVDLTANI